MFNIYLIARIAVPSNYEQYYRSLDNISVPKRYGLQLPRLLSARFRIYAGFVKFYGSLMVHDYGSEKSRVLNGTV